MRIADPRGHGGAGLFPLQAHPGEDKNKKGTAKWALDERPAMFAYRILDRMEEKDQVGHWVYERESVGDILGGFLWYQAGPPPKGRDLPAWEFAWPIVAKNDPDKVLSNPPCQCRPSGDLYALPLADDKYC